MPGTGDHACTPGSTCRFLRLAGLPRAAVSSSEHEYRSERAKGSGQRRPLGSCKHGEVTQIGSGRLRTANAEDGAQLLRLWSLLFDEDGTTSEEPW